MDVLAKYWLIIIFFKQLMIRANYILPIKMGQ